MIAERIDRFVLVLRIMHYKNMVILLRNLQLKLRRNFYMIANIENYKGNNKTFLWETKKKMKPTNIKTDV